VSPPDQRVELAAMLTAGGPGRGNGAAALAGPGRIGGGGRSGDQPATGGGGIAAFAFLQMRPEPRQPLRRARGAAAWASAFSSSARAGPTVPPPGWRRRARSGFRDGPD